MGRHLPRADLHHLFPIRKGKRIVGDEERKSFSGCGSFWSLERFLLFWSIASRTSRGTGGPGPNRERKSSNLCLILSSSSFLTSKHVILYVSGFRPRSKVCFFLGGASRFINHMGSPGSLPFDTYKSTERQRERERICFAFFMGET